MSKEIKNYIKWGFESRLKQAQEIQSKIQHYIKWGFESRLKLQRSLNG